MRLRKPYLLAVLVGAGLLAWSTPMGCTPRTDSTRRMAERLEALADSNTYEAAARVEVLAGRTPPPGERVVHLMELAAAFAQAGSYARSLEITDEIRRARENGKIYLSAARRDRLRELEGQAHLRLAMQLRCPPEDSSAGCILDPDIGRKTPDESRSPDPDQTRHLDRALSAYRYLLGRFPDDLRSRWLLNLLHQWKGTYPDSVSATHRIDPAALADEARMNRWSERAAERGLAVLTRSGGSVLEDFDRDGDLDVMASDWSLEEQIRYYENDGTGHFRERTRAMGLTGITGGLNLVHADYDGDGYPDVLVLRGAWLGAQGRHPGSLLRNQSGNGFTDVTEEAGLLSFHPTQTGAWADYDGDGDLDLFVGNETQGGETHPCELFRNEGDGTFTEIAASVGLDVRAFVKGVAWGDVNGDDRPDLYLSVLGGRNHLFRNEGPDEEGWRFRDVTETAGVAGPPHSFPVWFWDYDQDGHLDLFVGAHRTGRVPRTPRYENAVHDLMREYRARGSGTSLTDADLRSVPALYRNRGDGTFEDKTAETGLVRAVYAMGANFGDLDGDGRLDVYLGTGDPDLRTLMPNRVFRQKTDGRFEDVTVSSGLGLLAKGHGVSFGDVDGDGDEDLFTVMGGAMHGDRAPNRLFLQPGGGAHTPADDEFGASADSLYRDDPRATVESHPESSRWIVLRLEGTESNRSAIGTRLRLTVRSGANEERHLHRTVGTGGSFGSSSLQQEIGLGEADRVERLVVEWPASGTRQVFTDLRAGRSYRIVEGTGLPVPVDSL